MKAALIKDHGELEHLIVGDLNIPQIKLNEVLIETKYGVIKGSFERL